MDLAHLMLMNLCLHALNLKLAPILIIWWGRRLFNICSNCFRKLEDGDIVNVDVTVYYKGYHGKTCNWSVLIDPNKFIFLLIANLKRLKCRWSQWDILRRRSWWRVPTFSPVYLRVFGESYSHGYVSIMHHGLYNINFVIPRKNIYEVFE